MATDQTCYFPDGSVATRDTPCRSPSAGASACCAYMDVCLDNHLCLAQTGSEIVVRGSCTDAKWENPECSSYCSDAQLLREEHRVNIKGAVSRDNGQAIFPVFVDRHTMFCCGQFDTANGTCKYSNKGSYTPFSVPAGLVIFNRTSGSTSPNDTDAVSATTTVTATATLSTSPDSTEAVSATTVVTTIASMSTCPINTKTVSATTTVTATATVSASNSSPTHTAPPSRKDVAISAAMSGFLGLAFLIALALLWKQGKHKRKLSKEMQTWQKRYTELKTIADLEQHQPSHQLHGWKPGELDGRQHLGHPLWDGERGEVGGAQVYEMAERTGRA